MSYTFRIGPYDTNKLLPQVSKALEKRTELISRERFPGMWKLTDKFNSMARGRTRGRLRTGMMSILCILLGLVLFVPGLMEPQKLFVPLTTGAVAIGAGIGGLRRSRKQKNPFDKSARLLLAGKDNILTEQGAGVCFSDDGMTIISDNADAAFAAYSDFECVIETADAFLLVYRDRAAVLQKSDSTTDNINEFYQFISQKIKSVSLSPQADIK